MAHHNEVRFRDLTVLLPPQLKARSFARRARSCIRSGLFRRAISRHFAAARRTVLALFSYDASSDFDSKKISFGGVR